MVLHHERVSRHTAHQLLRLLPEEGYRIALDHKIIIVCIVVFGRKGYGVFLLFTQLHKSIVGHGHPAVVATCQSQSHQHKEYKRSHQQIKSSIPHRHSFDIHGNQIPTGSDVRRAKPETRAHAIGDALPHASHKSLTNSGCNGDTA